MSIAHRLIIADICAVICKYHQGFKRYRADTKYSHTMLNLKLWPWPWTDICQKRHCTSFHRSRHLCRVICKSNQGFKRYRANMKYSHTILDCDLDFEQTLVKHRHCTSSYYTWRLCKVICKSHQEFKRYRADTKVWQTDGRTDRQTMELKTICLPITWGET